MTIDALRQLAGREEIDYAFLVSALRNYGRPRDKISLWLKSGELVRVKKGLYIFGQSASQWPYSKELLANLIYGPSIISLTYALYYYGLIPERVETITSITTQRIKSFNTPVGRFDYYYLNPKKYTIGSVLNNSHSHQNFLIATPEKALCDHIFLVDKKDSFNNINDLEQYLTKNLRINHELLEIFNLNHLREIVSVYRNKKLDFLYQYCKKINKKVFKKQEG